MRQHCDDDRMASRPETYTYSRKDRSRCSRMEVVLCLAERTKLLWVSRMSAMTMGSSIAEKREEQKRMARAIGVPKDYEHTHDSILGVKP